MMQVLVHCTAMVGSLQLWFLIHFVNDWQYWPSLILCTACCTLEHSSCALIRKAMWPPGFIPDADAASIHCKYHKENTYFVNIELNILKKLDLALSWWEYGNARNL